MKIMILGDVGASEYNVQAFCNADKKLFSTDIQDRCKDADIVIINLEKPLTDVMSPLGIRPPDFIAPTETINGIKLLHPSVATLANNHIMDQREQGLQSTINVLRQNDIQYVGVGNNLQEARKPIIISKSNTKVGIYACCEKEFSFATDSSSGANVFDPLFTFEDIEDLKKSCDYLIILFHGGMQGYPYPTPYQQRVCRKMCEKGADLVVCQHSHIIGCDEEYSNGRIVYGQGNFILEEVDDESWYSGLMIEVTIKDDDISVQYIPTQTSHHQVDLHPDASFVIESFKERSKTITKEQSVDSLFSDLSNTKLSDYLIKLSGKGYFIQRVFRRLGITKIYKKLYSKDACSLILDYFYCDSHRESIEYGLNQLMLEKEKNKDEDRRSMT